MSLFSDTSITLHQLSGKLKEMASRLSEDKFRDDLMPHAGRVMVNVIRIRFSRGSGPNKDKWMSTCTGTDAKHGGRWSVRYYRTKKGSNETYGPHSGSIRLFFTGGLMRSYKAKIEKTKVIVEPVGSNPDGVEYLTIAEGLLEQHNVIVGWDDESTEMVEKEIKAFLKRALA